LFGQDGLILISFVYSFIALFCATSTSYVNNRRKKNTRPKSSYLDLTLAQYPINIWRHHEKTGKSSFGFRASCGTTHRAPDFVRKPHKVNFLLTVARRTPESSIVTKNSVSTPAIFTKPAPTEQISTIAVKIEHKIFSYHCLHV